MRYQANAEDMRQHVATTEFLVTGDYGRGFHREVKFHVGENQYRVYDHGDLVLATASVMDAAEAFDSIRPRAESKR